MSVGTDRAHESGQTVTRAAVLDAALTLFARRGYHGTSLKQVAEVLGIRTPSLYNHMQSKAALLESIVLGQLEAIRVEFDEATEGIDDPTVKLRRATEAYALRHERHWRESLVVTDSLIHLDEPALSKARALRQKNERRFRDIIIEGQESGVFQVHSARFASFAIREACASMSRIYKEDERPSEYEKIGEYPEYGEYRGAEVPSSEEMAVWHGELALKVVGAKTRRRRR